MSKQDDVLTEESPARVVSVDVGQGECYATAALCRVEGEGCVVEKAWVQREGNGEWNLMMTRGELEPGYIMSPLKMDRMDAPPLTLADILQEPPAWMFGRGVEARNALQRCGKVHPFTCTTDSCRSSDEGGILTAVEEGWVCEGCGYKQALGPGTMWPFCGGV